jgi:predicted S18 family serine protease
MSKRILFLFFVFLLILSGAFALLDSGNIKIFAVTDNEVGMAADLKLYTIPGSGEVSFITSHSLVGKDTQTTGNIALEIARIKTGVLADKHTFIFDIRANATEVEGPSAGAAMTLLAYSVLSEKPLRSNVGITGTINSDGSVGVVGGVFPKAKVASEIGIKLFMIPKGESRQVIKEDGKVESINLLSYGPEKLGMKIIEVSTIDEVIKYAYSDIDSIQVDVTESTNGFVPTAIQYKQSLVPMDRMSTTYIERAYGVIAEAKKELETTSLSEDFRSRFYPQLGVTERNAEMASIFLDQNYLYSSANFAFNARILAGTIKEISANPSLLSKDSTILDNKINSLKREINLLKAEINYVTLDNYEWLIGAQQRIAYAENALVILELQKEELSLVPEPQMEDVLFDRVYEYVSARAWLDAAKDFMDEAKLSKKKVVPVYSNDFIEKTANKIKSTEKIIFDSNVSEATLSEAERRLNSAKISFDNNFFFAALYDAYFAEAFIFGETERLDYSDEKIMSIIQTDLPVKRELFDSVWSNLFADHAYFFFENAKYETEIGRTTASRSSLNTSYDLIVLAENIELAKDEVNFYLATTNFSDYVGKPELDTTIDISYTKKVDVLQTVAVVLVIAVIIFLGVLIFFSLRTSQMNIRGPIGTRISKLERVRSNLDSALSKKKISGHEYFFLKKRYDDEISLLKNKQGEISQTALNLDESKAKLHALEEGLKSLQKHYKAGIIIEEDFRKHYIDVTKEIAVLKVSIQEYESELRNSSREHKPKNKKGSNFEIIPVKEQVISLAKQKKSSKLKGTGEADDNIKGTDKLAEDEAKQDEKDKNERKKVLKKYNESRRLKKKSQRHKK